VSSYRSRENRFNHNSRPTADNYQVRLADSVLLFNTGAVSPGVIINFATVRGASVDAGLKYRGPFLQTTRNVRFNSRVIEVDRSPVSSLFGFHVGALFGIPLQQQWSYAITGTFAPTYYLQTDAPLYYYSFTDAYIAMAYRSLSSADQARLDPMITGFNPADMYAVDHIRRVLTTFPGVFSGIGEFTIHKEFVSGKIAGETASLTNPALDRILDFAAESGLVVLMHNDVDAPFPRPDHESYQLAQLRELFLRQPRTTIIWAHAGLGRVVRPVAQQLEILDRLLSSPLLPRVYIDLSWTETAKYIVATPESVAATAALINKHADRFLFGTDEVAPSDQSNYLHIYELYAPLFARLTPDASEKFRKSNFARLFDDGTAARACMGRDPQQGDT
jgi:predicted TIM-barrel fold metal-dependent hydrolase